MPKQTLTAQRTTPLLASITRVSTCLSAFESPSVTHGKRGHSARWSVKSFTPARFKIRALTPGRPHLPLQRVPDLGGPHTQKGCCPRCWAASVAEREKASGVWVPFSASIGTVAAGGEVCGRRVRICFGLQSSPTPAPKLQPNPVAHEPVRIGTYCTVKHQTGRGQSGLHLTDGRPLRRSTSPVFSLGNSGAPTSRPPVNSVNFWPNDVSEREEESPCPSLSMRRPRCEAGPRRTGGVNERVLRG